MRLNGSRGAEQYAKRLRREMSPPEVALWLALRQNEASLRFRRQYAAGNYILDFYCAPAMLAIEVDGEAHSRGDRPLRDEMRDAWLTAQGLHIMRFPGAEVLSNIDGVVRQILEVAMERCDQVKDLR